MGDYDIKQINDNINDELITACTINNFTAIKLLIEHGTDVNYINESRNTPLFLACKNENFKIVKYLIENGADVNYAKPETYEPESKYNTPLLYSCKYQMTNIVKYLIEHGAKVENIGKLLIEACFNNCLEMVKYFIAQGANINYCNSNGITPLTIACSNNYDTLAQFLVDHGAIADEKLYKFACTESDYEIFNSIVKFILKYNPNGLRTFINNTEAYLTFSLRNSAEQKV